jgi:Na+-driven multidrug efflux pump
MLEKNNKLLNRKFYKYLVPGILIALLLRFTSVMDGIIIGNRLGSMCLTSTSLSISALYISQLPGYALGVGSAIACSRLIGNRKIEEASKVNSIAIISTIILSLILALLAYPLSEPISRFISGGKDEYINYMKIYIFSYWITSPIIGLLLYYSNIMAVDNHPILSTAMVLVSSLLKILFMLITLYSFNINNMNTGMYLASLSTGFGALLSLIVVIFYLKSKKRLLNLVLKLKNHLIIYILRLKAAWLRY